MTPVRITACICHNTPFVQLLPLARANDWNLDMLIRQTGCGGNCGLCRPYLRRMLQTGETTFTELLSE